MSFQRFKKLLPTTQPMKSMVDAGMLVDMPEGKFPPVKGLSPKEEKKAKSIKNYAVFA